MENATPENETPTMYNHAIRYGVILSGISIALVVVFYVVSLSFMAGFKFIGLTLVIALGLVIYAGIDYRNQMGGFLPYGKAFVHGMTLLVVSGLIGTAFSLLLYQVIDPELGQKMTEAIIANTEDMMVGFGAPQASIDQTIDGIRAEMPDQFTVSGQILGFGKALIFYAIIALITSIFVKKNVAIEM